MNLYPNNKKIPESYNPQVEEKKILDFWAKKQTHEKIQESRRQESNGTLSFHSGPPFLTGSPHLGHVLNGIIKDVFTRYGYQNQQQVVSQFGWDCHGLPVEHEVDKKLGIKTPEDVEKLGVGSYNDECRKFVQRNEVQWKNIFERIGIWVDFTKTYSTMGADYMEGVWGVFKKLYDDGLVYRDTKVLPHSTECFTHLSDFEAERNWKEVIEVGLTISVSIVNSTAKLLIWTTAPWTLVANLAICVSPNARYVKVQLVANESVYIVSANRLPFVFTNSIDYVVLEELTGQQLTNLRYRPLFDYFSGSANAFQVLADECVRDELGTGIVALTPYFGEDDYRVCLQNDISFDEGQCPIDDSGRFKLHISEVAGLSIKEANCVITELLQQNGRLLHRENIKQKRPHCWRSDVPLIHKATSTWFIRVKDLTAKRKENESQVNWPYGNPDKSTSNRFEHFGDWAIGRSRFWGTPLPIWSSPSGDEIRCIGSVNELLQLTGCASISDLHREFVDELVIPSSIQGNPPLRRVPEVFDCWFESGAMPFIQQQSQADFIVEGLDQTYGWFYTTSVLSAALAQPPVAKDIFAHGLVLASDGSKISKRKHNQSDPIHLAEKYGADALRLHLVSSPLVHGQNFTLQEDEVRQMSEKVIQPLYSILRDLTPGFGKQGWVTYGIMNGSNYFANIFEQWILSYTESVRQFCDSEMEARRLHTVVPRIIELIEKVQDWYISIKPQRRENRTFPLFNIVYKICLMLTAFAPFFTEYVYQILEPFLNGCFRRDFINDCLSLEKKNGLIQWDLELAMDRWQMVIELVRDARMKRIIPIQYRISELIVVHSTETYLEDIEFLNENLMRMVNVNQITRTTDRLRFGAKYRAHLKPDSLLCQSMSATELEEIALLIKQLNDEEVDGVLRNGSVDIRDFSIPLEDIQISYQFDKEATSNVAISSKNDVFIAIRMNKDLEYYEEGTRLELISSIRKLKKKVGIFPNEPATVCYSTKDRCLRRALEKYTKDLNRSTNSSLKWVGNASDLEEGAVQESADIKGVPVTLYFIKNN